uniref:C-type lectin domain-containing protein n=1 Tax=Gadus morhua TaxID=8049 RepID=A0A8C5AZZ3_GADMO
PGLCIPSFCADYRQHCLIETPKSWFDAQSYCRERGYDLATIDDMGAMKSLLALNPERAHDWWIGLHYGAPEEWHWSLADEEFYQKGERNYRNFQNMDVTNSFVSHEHGKWYTVDHANLWFICYDDRYVLVRQVMSWTGAQLYCRKHHTDLVSIRNPEENQAVWKAILRYNVLIGLFKDAWHWSDKRNSSFRHWEQDSFVGLFPESCAVMTSQRPGRWSQRSCHDLHPFLCTCKQPLSGVVLVISYKEIKYMQ